MILVLGGTLEGREISGLLAAEGFEVLVSVVSGYGAELIPRDLPVNILVTQLDAPEMEDLIAERDIRLIIDATHPYARVITDTAWKISEKTGIPYIRYERPPIANKVQSDRVFRAGTYEEAAMMAVNTAETVFLTIGSRNLEPFIRIGREHQKRVVARVLPDAGVLEQCAALSMSPKDIIAIQGPFSLEMNRIMLREFGAGVLVTKDSGSTGGTDKKIAAAADLGIPVIIVARPDYRGIPVTDRIELILQYAEKVK